MQPTRRRTSRSFPALRHAFACATAALLLSASFATVAAPLADREFEQAVQSFRTGRVSEAFGQFADLANRGDVDSARIALFLSAYGATLYGKHWDVLQSDTAYWTMLVRNSGTSARAQPEFIPLKDDGRKARTPSARAPALRNVSATVR